MLITFTVPGLPIPQPRQRHKIIAGHVSNYTPARHAVQAYRRAIQIAARLAYQGPPLTCPLSVTLLFLMPRPQRLTWKTRPMPRVWCPCKPDFDNLAKSTIDCLTGIVWADDGQIASAKVEKMYAAGEEEPCVEVGIETL